MSSPFAPPERRSLVENDVPLADLGARFGAALIDGLVGSLPLAPLVLLMIGYQITLGDLPEDPPPSFIVTGLVCVAGMLAVAIYQWVQISNTGQSIGKKYLGIRIVKMDGSPVDFVSGVVIRSWVLNFATGILNYCCLGWVLTLVDIGLIFGDERRCLHDRLANTKVVIAVPAP